MVNIPSVNRLRKLRKHPDEDLIQQSEYVKRLRGQFVKLNPTPCWAELGNGNTGELDADDPLNTTSNLLDISGGERLMPSSLVFCYCRIPTDLSYASTFLSRAL
jgi:hypothetical protein